jgi:hypothetical protein
MKIMSTLDQLTQSISAYPKDQLIRMVVDQCWAIFLDKEVGLEQTGRGRHFVTCASWICIMLGISRSVYYRAIASGLTK